jgi:tetratricopeptide (TPR) repeat protein
MLVESGKVEDGVSEIQNAIRQHPNYWGHYDALGRAYYGAGRYPEAVKAFARVTELQPDNAWGYHMLATSHHAMDAVDKAIPFYRRSIQLGNTRSYSNLGVLYYSEGRYAEAAVAYEAAAKGDPKSSLKHHNLGDAYARLGQPEDARTEYELAAQLAREEIRVSPNDFRPMARLALIEAKLGHFASADKNLAAAVKLEARNADVLFSKAVVLALEKRLDASVSALEQAISQGYSAKRAASDPDLAVLRAHPEFEKRMASHRSAQPGGAN